MQHGGSKRKAPTDESAISAENWIGFIQFLCYAQNIEDAIGNKATIIQPGMIDTPKGELPQVIRD